jgi:hypothetical protein
MLFSQLAYDKTGRCYKHFMGVFYGRIKIVSAEACTPHQHTLVNFVTAVSYK